MPTDTQQNTPEGRGQVAAYREGLTREDRLKLVKRTTPEWRGRIAAFGADLTREDRLKLAKEDHKA